MNPGFQIVVPVYNEADVLPDVLHFALAAGYLHHVIFVDDASTDASPQILQAWEQSHAIRAVRLDRNRRKEGAIREVLEVLHSQGKLEPYTLLLDADSFIQCPANGDCVAAIREAIASMRDRGLAGMAFRIDAAIDRASNLLDRCQYADYSALQFDQWLTSHQEQLWVINGPGGMFRSDLLLRTLRDMQPDFETGDLLITVKLMRSGLGVAFYPELVVKTFCPRTVAAYFAQRRRWERGTTKVLWWQRRFYAGLFAKPRLLALGLLVHLSVYPGIAWLLLCAVSAPDRLRAVLDWFAASFVAWFAVNLAKGVWNKRMRGEGHFGRFVIHSALNGFLWFAVTLWARLAGFTDAILYLVAQRAGAMQRRPQAGAALD
ncbi:MAG TPA: glycosyltransferase family 2 protein [Burkholderiales bacterium]|nr:glycosyltransferase family 2 protein [Burkholderiales bacterium]